VLSEIIFLVKTACYSEKVYEMAPVYTALLKAL